MKLLQYDWGRPQVDSWQKGGCWGHQPQPNDQQHTERWFLASTRITAARNLPNAHGTTAKYNQLHYQTLRQSASRKFRSLEKSLRGHWQKEMMRTNLSGNEATTDCAKDPSNSARNKSFSRAILAGVIHTFLWQAGHSQSCLGQARGSGHWLCTFRLPQKGQKLSRFGIFTINLNSQKCKSR